MKKILPTAMCLGLLAAGCNKEDDPVADNAPVGGNTVVSVRFHWKWGLNTFDTAQTYTTSVPENIRLSMARFFVSQPWFEDDNGSVVAEFPAKYLLVDQVEGTMVRTIGEVNGHLQTLHFYVGLDSAANHSDPTLYAADDPLHVSNDMHWTWVQGYAFMKLEGRYDFDNDGDVDLAGNDQSFSYHCAGDVLRRYVEVVVNTDALSGGALVIDLDVDLETLLGDKDINATPVSQGSNAFAASLMNDLPAAIVGP